MRTCTIGIDFGTLSGRCVVVDCKTGQQLGEAVYNYPHGVMDEALPNGRKLPGQYALQHPQDYLDVVRITCPEAIKQAGVSPEEIVGVGIDFTSCTLIPVDENWTPLCMKPEYADEPHAYVKLWKHHAAQPQADIINKLARERGEKWIDVYGGSLSAEWALPKILEVCQEAPEIYDATARFIEAGEWLVTLLVGEECHGKSFAGFKFAYVNGQYPSEEFMTALDPKLSGIVGTKLSTDIKVICQSAGNINAYGASLTGLLEGTPVAVPQLDAHAAMPALQITGAGELMLIVGTSGVHIANGHVEQGIEGICGCVSDGVIPGYTTSEGGQAAVGDIFNWFVKNCTPENYAREAAEKGVSVHTLLTEKAKDMKHSGLMVLDWMNGNRVLNDFNLSGLILGINLLTKPEQIYRALLESTAYGTRMIVDNMADHDIAIEKVKAAGGIAQKNPLMMQIYADVLNREICICESAQASALGVAIYAAVVAGVYDNIQDAAQVMGTTVTKVYTPNAESHEIYDKLYQEYKKLHEYFGKGGNDVMKRLISIEM